jgi:hypothetical protein
MGCIICIRTYNLYCTITDFIAYDFVTNFIVLKIVIICPEACSGEEGEDEKSPSKSALKGGG